jgi:hypothetical protein
MSKNNSVIHTPYDDVFRTLVMDCKKLLIPLINETFGENYSGTEEIILKENELFIHRPDGTEDKRITDSLIEILRHKVGKDYHFECQSTPDGNIVVRIYDYDSQIALRESEIRNGVLEVRFPHSAILYLRSTKNTSDFLKIRIVTPDGDVSYTVPVIKMSDYKIEDIFKKNLLFLIPFYIFTYENEFKDIESNGERLRKLKETYADIRKTLDDMCVSGGLDEYTKCTLCEMTEKVINSIALNFQNIKKEVNEVMGGQILEYEAKNILNQGISEGISQGINLGISQGINLGISQGISQGINQGASILSDIIKKLTAENRQDEIERVLSDEKVRNEYINNYNNNQ